MEFGIFSLQSKVAHRSKVGWNRQAGVVAPRPGTRAAAAFQNILSKIGGPTRVRIKTGSKSISPSR